MKEWKAVVQKTKVIKRRWLHGSKDTSMRKWKKYIADIHAKLDAAGDRLRVVCRHLTGDFAASAFTEWKEICRKKKIAVRRLINRQLIFGWDRWVEHMDETHEVIRQVNIKCAHVVSLISGDLFHFCFHELQKYRTLKVTTRRVTAEHKTKIVTITWRSWLSELQQTGKIAQKIRERCASIVYYISHGACVECMASWKERVKKRKKALRMFTHACLVHTWHAWIDEFVARARAIKRSLVFASSPPSSLAPFPFCPFFNCSPPFSIPQILHMHWNMGCEV
jgi:hypothetical protein